jgi:glutathione gamma-glutamylcysteinyltransferase
MLSRNLASSDSLCCSGAAMLSRNLASSDSLCCSETCFKCVPANGDGPKTAISDFVVSEGNEPGVSMLLPMCHHSRSPYNSSMRDEIIKYPSSGDVLTVLLLALHPGTWSSIIDERLKAEFQTLVSTDDLPDVLKREVCCHNPSIPICLLCTLGKCFLGKEDTHMFSCGNHAKF